MSSIKFNSNDYIEVPVLDGEELETVSYINENDEKCYEFRIPKDGKYLYTQTIPYKVNEEDRESSKGKNRRPAIHMSEEQGWTNDPNGLIFDEGLYHFYYQYNPFGIRWENMCWGHAVSTDMLHWTRLEPVMYPDKDGTMFSGSAIKNKKGMLGLPESAILFYYTVAGSANDWSKGKPFVQKIAYSVDGGKSLIKMEEPCVGAMEEGTRDPKVFWHADSNSYVMVLYVYKNEFVIMRSDDMLHWTESDRFSFDEAWECPDLFELDVNDGTKKWVFWSADGFYFVGDFDGYKFKTDGKRHNAYLNKLPYAAQTYSGMCRVVSIPWLRMQNAGRLYTSAYGIPVEFSLKKKDDDFALIQWPVAHVFDAAIEMECEITSDEAAKASSSADHALMCHGGIDGSISFTANGTCVEYDYESGIISIGDEKIQAVKRSEDVLIILDDRILEIFLGSGESLLTYEIGIDDLPENKNELIMKTGLDNCKSYII